MPSRVSKRLTPGSATNGSFIPVWVAGVGTICVRVVFGVGIAVMELPIHQADVGVLYHGRVENSSDLISPGHTAAEVRRRLNSAFPGEDAVLVIRCVIAGISCCYVIREACHSASVQRSRLTERNNDVLSGVIRTTDRHSHRRGYRVHGSGVAPSHEFEVISARNPITGTDMDISLHAGRTYGEALRARGVVPQFSEAEPCPPKRMGCVEPELVSVAEPVTVALVVRGDPGQVPVAVSVAVPVESAVKLIGVGPVVIVVPPTPQDCDPLRDGRLNCRQRLYACGLSWRDGA
jgi:hypothetical protein